MEVNKLIWASLLISILVLSGCINQQQNTQISSNQQENTVSSKIGVIVSLLPQKQFIEKIGGDKVDVTVMVPPGASPHTYEPNPSQMKAVGNAKMYAKVGSGVEFETAWMDKIIATNSEMLIVDSSKGIKLIDMAEHHHHEDVDHMDVDHVDEHEEEEHMGEHEDEYHVDEHEHGGLDPHIWTSVRNAKVMVENTYLGLVQVDPENSDYYLENKNTYLKELEGLDKQLELSFSGLESKEFMVFHPAWGYLANDYGLSQVPVEQEGKEPSAKELTKLIDDAKEENIRVVFTSPQFNKATADTIAEEISGTVVMIDPLEEDYVSNMKMVSNEIKKAIT